MRATRMNRARTYSSGRVEERIEDLFDLARGPSDGATRLAYSPEEAQAMLLVAAWMEEAGLSPLLDHFGNIWGLPPVRGPFVTSGSHVDTVPNGGRYDGVLGTVLALEVAEELDGPFGVLVCAAEEAPRFGAGTLGSRQLVGKLSDESLAEMRDANGKSVLEARAEFLELLSDIPRLEEHGGPLSRVAAHAEIHIEQRRELKEQGASVGIATAVAGPARYRLSFAGTTGHSGETRMRERRDALCAAAETILLVERLAREAASTVATVGVMDVEPNSLTAIPGRVKLGLDVRSTDVQERDALVSAVASGSDGIACGRGVEFAVQKLSAADPTMLDGNLVEIVEDVSRRANVPVLRCVSHAGHDAQHLARRVPTALLFTASANGVSHAPEEDIDLGDLEKVLMLLAALLPELYEAYGGERR